MSTIKTEENTSIGLRITQERKRLGYSQATLSAKTGKSTATQISYEADETRPDADYFSALNKLGADIFYIITGEQLEALKAEDERQLLANYRSVFDRHKPVILNLVEGIAEVDQSDKKNTTNKNKK